MYDFDITLLVLSPPSSYASTKILQMFDYFNGSGLNCQVATHPLELANMRRHSRRHLVILDGTDNSEHDVEALAVSLGSLHLFFVVLVLNNSQCPVNSGREGTINLHLSIRLSRDELVKKITTALNGESALKAEVSAENYCYGQGQPPRLRQHPQWILPTYSGVIAEVAPVAIKQKDDIWILEDKGWRLIAPTGIAVRLTRIERKLMRRFLKSPACPVLHQEFEDKDSSLSEPHSRTLTVVVSRLRRKFRAAGITLPIQSNRGDGYQFNGRCSSSEEAGLYNDRRSFMSQFRRR